MERWLIAKHAYVLVPNGGTLGLTRPGQRSEECPTPQHRFRRNTRLSRHLQKMASSTAPTTMIAEPYHVTEDFIT